MDIVVEPLSAVPIYQQIRDRVVELIAAGQLRSGDALTPIRALAAAFGINPATVVKAYDLLREEGFVTSNRRLGTIIAEVSVADPLAAEWQRRLDTLLAEAIARGADTSAVLDACADAITRIGGPR